MFTAYQLHLPSDVRIFRYTATPTVITPGAMVFDGVLTETKRIVCRSYLFFARWLEIFVTFDEHLTLHADRTTLFPFAFNCDLTTPYHHVGNRLFTTDLCVDVLVAPDGGTYQLKDTDEFEERYMQGAFGRIWYDGVQRELAGLTRRLESKQFLSFLNDIAPFPTEHPTTQLSTMEHHDLATTTFEYHPWYPRYS